MTEPPRPPGEGVPGGSPDPTSPPPPPPGSYSVPGEAPAPGYVPPPTSGGGGYAPPPGGGYNPPPGGGFQAPGPAPVGYANSDEKTWALVAHFGGAAGMLLGAGAGGWLPPLIALLAKGNTSPTVRAHAAAALNFQILWSVVGIIGWVLTCAVIGVVIWLAAMVLGIIFGIIAGMKANEGQFYKYPMSLNIIK